MTPYAATKKALKRYADSVGITLDLDKVVFRGGQDPGGWSGKGSAVCVIHEGTDIPNEYNHPAWLDWWVELGGEVSKLSGKRVYFEAVNSCVSTAYTF